MKNGRKCYIDDEGAILAGPNKGGDVSGLGGYFEGLRSPLTGRDTGEKAYGGVGGHSSVSETSRTGWEFNWKKNAKEGYAIDAFKLEGGDDVEGLIAYKWVPENRAYYAHNVEAAPKNKRGKGGGNTGIARAMLAHLARKAIEKDPDDPYIYARPKTVLIPFYEKMGFKPYGGGQIQLSSKALWELAEEAED